MFNREEAIIKLGKKMCQGELSITPESAEYELLDLLLTDDELQVMYALALMKPLPPSAVAARAKMPVAKVKRILRDLVKRAIIADAIVPGVNLEFYLLPVFAPGLFEFLLTNDRFMEENPEVAFLFERHCDISYQEVGPSSPMGVGIMRVIPVESSLPAETKQISMERLSYLLDTTIAGSFCLVPCQCRRVRRIMGEGIGEREEGMCLYSGLLAESMLRHGRGYRVTKEEAYEHIKRVEEMGCMHQITTLYNGLTFAVCNCNPKSCLALGATQYLNAPNMSRSNYVAQVNKENCVACGQCVEICAGGALKLGQKICPKTPIENKWSDLPDDLEWGPDHWNPDYRNNRENVVETGTSPCKTTCPAHIAIQGYIRLAAQGKYMEALELIKKENPFPAVCGRVCPHNCENECTRGDIDKPIAIDEIKKFIADRELDENQRFIPKRFHDYDKKIAVIGSGPAGLACAYYLAADGYKVTVFEKEMRPGGMLVYGIPGFRLEKDVVDAEISVLRAMNVRFKCNTEVGKDVTIPELREQGYEAFYLGIGLQNGGKLNISGEDAEGVMPGIEFLKKVNRGEDYKLSGNVVVIGGGNIGADVARTALRYGADCVDLYCLESYEEMPMGEEDKENCEFDNVTIHAGWGQTEILTKSGKCKGVKFRKCTSVKDADGKFNPTFDNSVTEEAECTAVLYCIGQKVDWGTLLEGTNVELDERGLVVVDPLTYATSEPDIFAGGDVSTGMKFVIDAIAAGKQGAISINRAVWKGHSLTLSRDRRNYIALDKENLDFDHISYDNTSRQVPGVDHAKLHSVADERLTFTEEQLKKETARCLGCGATIVDENKCLGCGICTTRCKFDAISLKKKYDVPIHGLLTRQKYIEEYREERNKKIAIRKMRDEA